MAEDDTGQESGRDFRKFIEGAEPRGPDELPERRIVEFVGRVFKSETPDTFEMAFTSPETGDERVIEARVEDVTRYEVAFEDSSGRKTCKVLNRPGLPGGCLV